MGFNNFYFNWNSVGSILNQSLGNSMAVLYKSSHGQKAWVERVDKAKRIY